MGKRMIGGAIDDGQCGGAIEVELGGDLHDVIRLHREALARGIEIGVAHDAVARRKGGNAGADAFDHAGELAPRRERKCRLGLVLAGDDQRIEEIEPDRRDPRDHLARSGDRIGNIGEHEVIGRTEPLAKYRFHLPSPSHCRIFPEYWRMSPLPVRITEIGR